MDLPLKQFVEYTAPRLSSRAIPPKHLFPRQTYENKTVKVIIKKNASVEEFSL